MQNGSTALVDLRTPTPAVCARTAAGQSPPLSEYRRTCSAPSARTTAAFTSLDT